MSEPSLFSNAERLIAVVLSSIIAILLVGCSPKPKGKYYREGIMINQSGTRIECAELIDFNNVEGGCLFTSQRQYLDKGQEIINRHEYFGEWTWNKEKNTALLKLKYVQTAFRKKEDDAKSWKYVNLSLPEIWTGLKVQDDGALYVLNSTSNEDLELDPRTFRRLD